MSVTILRGGIMRKKKMRDYDKIKIAVARMIDTWDMETLIQYAVEERIDYYTSENVCEEEVEQLLEEWR